MGISEIVRRVIAKEIERAIRDDVKEVTGSQQCAGLQGACEASAKAIYQIYEEIKTRT